MATNPHSMSVFHKLILATMSGILAYGSYLGSDWLFQHLLADKTPEPAQSSTGSSLGLLAPEQYEKAKPDIRLVISTGAGVSDPIRKTITYRNYLRGMVNGEQLYLYNATKREAYARENIPFFEGLGFTVVRVENTSRPYPTTYMAGGTGAVALSGLFDIPYWKWVKTPGFASVVALGEDWEQIKKGLDEKITHSPEMEVSLQ